MNWRQLTAGASVLWSLTGYTTLAQSQPAVMHFTEHEEQPQNRFIDEPRVNPSPRKILVFQGHKDRGIEIWFDSAYSTTNEECRTQSLGNRILGAPDVPQAVIDSMRVPAEQTEFSVRFFLDRYLPGRCDWQPIAVGHAECSVPSYREADRGDVAEEQRLLYVAATRCGRKLLLFHRISITRRRQKFVEPSRFLHRRVKASLS